MYNNEKKNSIYCYIIYLRFIKFENNYYFTSFFFNFLLLHLLIIIILIKKI